MLLGGLGGNEPVARHVELATELCVRASTASPRCTAAAGLGAGPDRLSA